MGKTIAVIGAGLAGITIANELAKNHSVICIERGPERGYRYPKLRFDDKSFGNVETSALGIGGTTNLWHNGLIPILRDDVQNQIFRGVLDRSAEKMNIAAQALNHPTPHFDSDYANSISEMQEMAEGTGINGTTFDALLYPNTIGPLILNDSVQIHCDAENIEFSASGRQVREVRFNRAGRAVSVEADCVVICAGGLHSPSLVAQALKALNSPDQIQTAGLIDHPMGFFGKITLRRDFLEVANQISLAKRSGFDYRGIIRLTSPDGVYRAAAFLRPSMTAENDLDIYQYKSLLGASAGAKRIKHTFDRRVFHPDILTEIYAKFVGRHLPTRNYSVMMVAEQRPNHRNSVRHRNNQTEINWSLTKHELEAYAAMLQSLKASLANISDSVSFNTNPDHNWFWSAAHHSGTVSMGASNDDSVDGELRVRGSDNVYVCDASIIQEHSYANTGLTIAQIALSLAQQLSEH